jgi:adenine phosphoribosyltransferase
VSSGLHDELVASLRYFDGHSDTLGLFADAGFLERAGGALAAPFRNAGVQKVVGIEACGFVLATAVALELGAGFVAIRKPGGSMPGRRPSSQRRQTGADASKPCVSSDT